MKLRTALAFSLVAALAVGGAVDGRPRPAEPQVVVAPPPPPPPAGPVTLPSRLLADAAAYQAFMERTGTPSPVFTNGAEVAAALRESTAYEPQALIRGAVAYAAVAALEDATFVAEIRNAGNTPENRRLMVGYLVNDPAYALLFKGADGAAGLARQALADGGLRLYQHGRAVRQSSYDIQHQPWSKEEVADRSGRLAAVEAEGKAPLPPASDHLDALQKATSGAAPLTIAAAPVAPPYTPLVARAIQLAAIAALGEASEDSYDQLAALAVDEGTSSCLHMAKLNLYQCLAVAKPHYEDVFCMGQHSMADPGVCLIRNSGAAVPIEAPPPAPVPVPTRKPSRRTS